MSTRKKKSDKNNSELTALSRTTLDFRSNNNTNSNASSHNNPNYGNTSNNNENLPMAVTKTSSVAANAANVALSLFLSKAPKKLLVVHKAFTSKKPKQVRQNKNGSEEQLIKEDKFSQENPTSNYESQVYSIGDRRLSRSLDEIKIDPTSRSEHLRRPSEPIPMRNKNNSKHDFVYQHTTTNDSRNNNSNSGLPAISIQHVDHTPFSSITTTKSNNSNTSTSLIVLKEGFLNKKIDFDPKSANSRGWKVYRVILRGSKLYFYKPPSEEVLKTFFGASKNTDNNNKDFISGNEISSNLSPITENERGMDLNPINFDSNLRTLIFGDDSTNGQDWDNRSVSSTRGITDKDNSNDTNRQGKGYFTKWKLDGCYPIHNVDVIPDPNLTSGYSPYIAPSSQPNYFSPTQRVNDDNSSIHSFSSNLSATQSTPSSSGTILYLSIVDGEQEQYRVFFTSSSEKRKLWAAKLFAAKEASLRKMVRLKSPNEISNEKIPNGYNNEASENLNGATTVPVSSEKNDGGGGPSLRRGRAFWGTGKHPELVTKEPQYQQSHLVNIFENPGQSYQVEQPKTERCIRGGSIDSLIHEIVFQTQKDEQDNDEYLYAFLLTYPLFTDVHFIFRELRRYASVQFSLSEDDELFKSKAISKRLITILETWCICFDADLAREDIFDEMVETVDQELIKNDIPGAENLKKLIQTKRTRIEKEISNAALPSLPPSPQFSQDYLSDQESADLDLSNLLITGLTPALFLKMKPEELARQLYIYHFAEFRKFNPARDLKNFTPSSANMNSGENPLNFTATKPHFITRLILHHLLIATQQSAYASRRPALLNHWIRTGVECKLLGDMVGWMAVASGVCSPGVVRLKETWKRVPENLRKVIVNEWAQILLDCGGMEGDVDSSNLRSLLLHRKNDEDNIESSKNEDESPSTQLIPYFAFEIDTVFSGGDSVATIINNRLKTIESSTCSFTAKPQLQKYFQHLNTIPASSSLDAWQLFESSLACEPRVHGQYLELNARQRKSHSAYFPLLFTEVIPSNRLFERKAFLDASGALGRKSSNSSINHENTKIGPLTSTTWNTGLDLVTRNWLGGFVQSRGGDKLLLKSMKDIAGVDEILLFVKDGELVFKSIRDATGSRPQSIVESSSSSFAENLSKRNSFIALAHHQLSPSSTSLGINNTVGNNDESSLIVVVKAGTLERLLDVLINGVASYSTSVVDDNGEPPLIIAKQGQLTISSVEYMATFFATYRSFCSASMLLDNLKKRFMNAKSLAKYPQDSIPTITFTKEKASESSETTTYDWKMLAMIQTRILSVLEYWIQESFHDFSDDLALKNRMMHFIDEFRVEVDQWSNIVNDDELSRYYAEEVKALVLSLKRLALLKSYEPSCDIQNGKSIALLDTMLKTEKTNIRNDTTDLPPIIQSIENNNIADLLDSIDLIVLELFEAVSPNDWVLAFEILETQSAEVLGWYPKKQTSWIPDDELVITDIFTTLSQTNWVGNNKDSVINVLPPSIQALFRVHYSIRNWTMHEVTSTQIDFLSRVKRIDSLLNMISLSRKRMAKMDIYPKDETTSHHYQYESNESRRSVPSFVESAIVGGLISPECRLFTRAWLEISIQRNCSLETLEPLLHHSRMLEICCNIPDMSFESDKLINFDKRRYVYNLIQIFVRSQLDLVERADHRHPVIDVRFLKINNSLQLKIGKTDLRVLKEISTKETFNMKFGNLPSSLGKSLKQPTFNKLLSEQQEKLKRDQKEREKLIKEIRETQHKLQKQRNEEARLLEKRSKEQQQKQQQQLQQDQSHHNGGLLVINLINSQTSVDYGLIQKESVFRIVSEEGGQYLFQALNDEDMHDWISKITESAKEGAARRYTVFKADAVHHDDNNNNEKIDMSMDSQPPPKTRGSVYGKAISTLMRNGEIPILVEKCICEIEKRGLNEVGIYRVPGSQTAINNLQKAFNTNAHLVDLSGEEYSDIYVVADALKLFFRSLPEPVMTYELYDDFIKVAALENHDQRSAAIKDLLQRLPNSNYCLLKRLMEHLERITDYEEINHMYAHNLAIVFGPTLLKSPNFGITMTNLGIHTGIVKNLILQYHWFFNIEEEATDNEFNELSDPNTQDEDREIEDELQYNPHSEIPISDDNSSSGEVENVWEANSSAAETFGGESYDESEMIEFQQQESIISTDDQSFNEEEFEDHRQQLKNKDSDIRQSSASSLDDGHQMVDQFFVGAAAASGNRESMLTDVIEDPEGEQESGNEQLIILN
ncbi:269_t:CDS:10 [Ambispora gerdemannii]|uniref:269_t:CDS:1 n=1 Tax=Ambispora gerdemannii TaxID=144530 RepID=A0A9N8VGU0_9GLOM|nr:269_t:CDS:10 [Ambispora gerdemannii]